MSSSNITPPNLSSAPLRGCTRGHTRLRRRAQARGWARAQSCRETQRPFFSTPLQSNAGTVN